MNNRTILIVAAAVGVLLLLRSQRRTVALTPGVATQQATNAQYLSSPATASATPQAVGGALGSLVRGIFGGGTPTTTTGTGGDYTNAATASATDLAGQPTYVDFSNADADPTNAPARELALGYA